LIAELVSLPALLFSCCQAGSPTLPTKGAGPTLLPAASVKGQDWLFCVHVIRGAALPQPCHQGQVFSTAPKKGQGVGPALPCSCPQGWPTSIYATRTSSTLLPKQGVGQLFQVLQPVRARASSLECWSAKASKGQGQLSCCHPTGPGLLHCLSKSQGQLCAAFEYQHGPRRQPRSGTCTSPSVVTWTKDAVGPRHDFRKQHKLGHHDSPSCSHQVVFHHPLFSSSVSLHNAQTILLLLLSCFSITHLLIENRVCSTSILSLLTIRVSVEKSHVILIVLPLYVSWSFAAFNILSLFCLFSVCLLCAKGTFFLVQSICYSV
jgi:hypothetical protein